MIVKERKPKNYLRCGYSNRDIPKGSNFIKSSPNHQHLLGLKKQRNKDSVSYMQRQEARVWIDDILENIPIDFALPVHDSIIVKSIDADVAMDWCKERHPEIVFTLKEI